MNKSLAAGGLIIIAAVIGLSVWLVRKDEEPERPRYNSTMVYPHPARGFMDYLEPITSEGLHEVRWDHKPPTLKPSFATTTSSTSAFFSAVTCSMVPVVSSIVIPTTYYTAVSR